MARKNHKRRHVLQALGTGLIGATGITSAKQNSVNESNTVNIEVTDTPQWIEQNPVEGANVVDVSLSVGYYGSELQQRWVNGSLVDRWVHFLETTFTATSDTSTGSYNIYKQFFKTQFYDGTEHNGSPSAGSAAWPDPPLGNWTQVVDAVVEGSLGALSTIASIGLSADDVKNAYENDSFDTDRTDKIELGDNYSGYTRESASHSVNFTADQVPGTLGTLHIVSGAGDVGSSSDVSAEIYLYPKDDDMYKDPIDTQSGSLRSSFDTMTQAELAEYGVKRVDPKNISEQTIKRSPFDFNGNKPIYIKPFSFDVEFGAENGSITSSPTTKE